MNILITGGLGVNGYWVTLRLAEMGHRTIVLENRAAVLDTIDHENVVIVEGDILDISQLSETIHRYQIETIAHLAAIMPDAAQEEPVLGFQINAGGTVNVLEAARLNKVPRVVATSSKGALAPCLNEYGHPQYRPVKESYRAWPERPTTVYGAAKVASELMGNAYADLFDFEFVALRFATIYGPGKEERHGTLAVYGQMIENAANGVKTVIEQGGDEKNDVIYVKDVATAIVSACLASHVTDRVFHIGSGVGITYNDFADAIHQFIPEAEFEIGSGLRKNPGTACVMDSTRAHEVLGWSTAFDLCGGIRDYLRTMETLTRTW